MYLTETYYTESTAIENVVSFLMEDCGLRKVSDILETFENLSSYELDYILNEDIILEYLAETQNYRSESDLMLMSESLSYDDIDYILYEGLDELINEINLGAVASGLGAAGKYLGGRAASFAGRQARKGATAVSRGAAATGRAIGNAASATGRSARNAAMSAGRATRDAAMSAGRATRDAAMSAGRATRDAAMSAGSFAGRKAREGVSAAGRGAASAGRFAGRQAGRMGSAVISGGQRLGSAAYRGGERAKAMGDTAKSAIGSTARGLVSKAKQVGQNLSSAARQRLGQATEKAKQIRNRISSAVDATKLGAKNAYDTAARNASYYSNLAGRQAQENIGKVSSAIRNKAQSVKQGAKALGSKIAGSELVQGTRAAYQRGAEQSTRQMYGNRVARGVGKLGDVDPQNYLLNRGGDRNRLRMNVTAMTNPPTTGFYGGIKPLKTGSSDIGYGKGKSRLTYSGGKVTPVGQKGQTLSGSARTAARTRTPMFRQMDYRWK